MLEKILWADDKVWKRCFLFITICWLHICYHSKLQTQNTLSKDQKFCFWEFIMIGANLAKYKSQGRRFTTHSMSTWSFSELQTNQGYGSRPCLKNKQVNNKSKQTHKKGKREGNEREGYFPWVLEGLHLNQFDFSHKTLQTLTSTMARL